MEIDYRKSIFHACKMGESNGTCVMGTHVNGVKCDTVESVKINTLKWFAHMEKRVKSLFRKNCQ